MPTHDKKSRVEMPGAAVHDHACAAVTDKAVAAPGEVLAETKTPVGKKNKAA